MAKTNGKDAINPLIKELIAQQNSVVSKSSMTAEEMAANVKLWIPTGSYALDKILSNNKEYGGWPCGRIVEVYGAESTGKSTLAYQAMANTQKMGGICIFFDAEQAGSRDMMRFCGVNTDEVVYNDLSEIEKIFEALEKNLIYISSLKEYKDKPVFVLIDSIAALITKDEEEGSYEHNMNIATKKAVQLGKALRKITPLLNKANACLYFVNQIRDKIGVVFGNPECVDPHTTKVKLKISKNTYEKYFLNK